MRGKIRARSRINSAMAAMAVFLAGLRSGDPDKFLDAIESAFGMRTRYLTEELAYAVEGAADGVAEVLPRMEPLDNRGQLGFQTLIAAFVVVITGMAVILVLDKFDASLGTPSSNDLSNSSDNLLSGFSSMVDIIEPLLLVAIVVVVIALVRRVQ